MCFVFGALLISFALKAVQSSSSRAACSSQWWNRSQSQRQSGAAYALLGMRRRRHRGNAQFTGGLPTPELTHFPIQFWATPTFGYAPSSKFASLIFGSLCWSFFNSPPFAIYANRLKLRTAARPADWNGMDTGIGTGFGFGFVFGFLDTHSYLNAKWKTIANYFKLV